jgi:8-oxo-dGTP diphosphatase
VIDQNIFIERNFHGVKGLVFIGDKMLVYRRDTNTDSFPLHIDLPGGGKENHESPFDAFKREVEEEIGIQIDKSDIRYAKKYVSPMDSSKESYFIATKSLGIEEKDIVFGNEGLEFFLMNPKEYLNLSDGINRQQNKVTECLDNLNQLASP